MNAVFADTSAWYALINPQDAHHRNAKRFLDEHTGMLMTSNYVVAETANLTLYRLGASPALEFLEILRQTTLVELVVVTPQQHERSVTLFAQYAAAGLSFTDCSSIALMQEQHVTYAFCFDADFRRAGLTCVP